MSDFGNALAAAAARNSRLAGYAPPLSVALPVIDGEGHVGTPMACTTGVWDHVPTGYAYQWKSGGTNVGTNASTYTLVEADAGKAVTCVVSATNATGTTTATSTPVVIAGGGTPSWVPSGAKVHVDFLGGTPQGRAWVDGVGEVAVAALVGNDPNADDAWAITGYSSTWLVADGCDPALALGFIGAARTKILAGATLKFNLKNGGVDPVYSYLVLVSADGGDGFDAAAGVTGISFSTLNGSKNAGVPVVINRALAALNGIACTYTATRFEAAANGNATLIAVSLGGADLPPGNPVVAAMMDCKTDLIVRSVTIYDPLPTTAGLSALSATPSD